ncbi:MAG: phosphohistidine phosphatase SixA [Pseudomonadota bacterium]
MQLFVMRHGEAAAGADADANRELTPQGQADVQAMATQYQHKLAPIDEIWSSPYVRAQQTAVILSDVINKPVIQQDWLTPTDNSDHLMNTLKECNKTILVVGHQPYVGTLVDRLADLEPGRYRMGTGSLACIELELLAYRCGELKWLHHPEV